MRVLKISLENFASYKELEFDFNNQGLSLIHGATGSGKSTLCDVVPWALFGKTAKNGAVDEVLSWPGDEVTKVTVWLDSGTISRSRGPKPKDNDLSFLPNDGIVTRGKDLQDTQKLINQFLGIDVDLYLSGAYFHEFSQTAQFFTTTAKNRRAICEQLVDLSLPKKLQDKIKDNNKELHKKLSGLEFDFTTTQAHLATLMRMQELENNRANSWDKTQAYKIKVEEKMLLSFEENRNKRIEQLIRLASQEAKSKICSECGAIKSITHKHKNNDKEIDQIKTEENPYKDRLLSLMQEINPHVGSIKDFSDEMQGAKTKINYYNKQQTQLLLESSDLELLSDSVQDFRGLLIKNTILDIESQTNLLLSNHFDAEIKIELSVEDDDKLEATILKDGNKASYAQLSKGQRQILKLCFGVSVMRCVSNHHGVDFSQLWFDESTDGMDETNKIRSMKMLETLALDRGVYIVEHSSEIKAMAENKFKVTLVDGNSQIEEDI